MQITSASYHPPARHLAGAGDSTGNRSSASQAVSAPTQSVEPATTSERQSTVAAGAERATDGENALSADRAAARKRVEEAQEALDLETVRELAARDREVRAHEQAHMAAGGGYAGSARYSYERGPDGVYYAIGGEVPISTGEEPSPEATLRKARIVRRAALAPREPSAADRAVAAQATAMELRALQDLAQQAQEAHAAQKGAEARPGSAAAHPLEPSPTGKDSGVVRGQPAPDAQTAPERPPQSRPNPYASAPVAGQVLNQFA